ELDTREAIDAHPHTAGADDDLIADRHLLERLLLKRDDDVLGESPTLAGNDAARTLRAARHHHRLVAHAGKDVECLVCSRLRRLDSHARLDVVTGPAVHAVPEAHVVDDPTEVG